MDITQQADGQTDYELAVQVYEFARCIMILMVGVPLLFIACAAYAWVEERAMKNPSYAAYREYMDDPDGEAFARAA